MQFFLKKFHCLYFLSYLCTDEKRTASDGIVLSRHGKLKNNFCIIRKHNDKKSILQVGRLHFFA